MRRRCSLCGGKLNGTVCTECGLDNSKSDDNYVTGKSHGDEMGLTHVHTENEDPFSGKTMTYQQQEQLKAAIRQRRKPENRKAADKEARKNVYRAVSTSMPKKKGKIWIGVIIGIIIVLIVSIPVMIEFAEEAFGPGFLGFGVEEGTEAVDWDEDPAAMMDYDPYYWVDEELPEDGEAYEVTLGPGTYKGGVHIPVGQYDLKYIEGQGFLTLDDSDRSIYLFGSFGYEDSEGLEPADDFRVYEGGLVKIDGTLTIRLLSENAQMDLNYLENPNTESFTLSESFVAGEDIPAGVYDLTLLEGKGSVGYKIMIDEATDYYNYEDIDFMVEGAKEYKNVVLPEGLEVELYGTVKILFTPSQVIESEDYRSFYPIIEAASPYPLLAF